MAKPFNVSTQTLWSNGTVAAGITGAATAFSLVRRKPVAAVSARGLEGSAKDCRFNGNLLGQMGELINGLIRGRNEVEEMTGERGERDVLENEHLSGLTGLTTKTRRGRRASVVVVATAAERHGL